MLAVQVARMGRKKVGMSQENIEDQGNEEEQFETFDVLELESGEGETESFVIMDKVTLKGNEYAILILLSDMELMESMSSEEFNELYGDQPYFQLMRVEGEFYYEVLDEEFGEIQEELEQKMAELSE